MKCCPPASRNFLTRRALRDIPKGLSLQNAWVLSTTCVSLMALYSIPWATFDMQGSFQEVFVIMWLSVSCWFSFLIPPYSPIWFMAECGQRHFDKDDQLSTTKGVDMNMHYGTNSSLLLVISWTATVFEASFWQIWAQGFLRWPLYQTPFVVAMAALLVAGKPSVAATSMETLTKTNTLAKHARQQFQVLKCMRSWISQKCTKGKL